MKDRTKPLEQISTCRAIIIWKDKILLHHRDNKPEIPYPDCWTFPGGGIEQDETPAEGIVRELIEEAYYSPKSLQYIGYRLNENRTLTYVFFAFIGSKEAKLFKRGIEGQGIGFFTLNEIGRLNFPALSDRLLKKYRKVIEESIKTSKLPSSQSLGLTV